MDNRRMEYTFLWYIENYSYCWHRREERLISPNFIVDKLEGTMWELSLYPRGNDRERSDHISLFLRRHARDDMPEVISIDYELSVIAVDGSSTRVKGNNCTFEKGEIRGEEKFLKTDEVLMQRKSDYLPQDILTVRCVIRKGTGKVLHIGQSSAGSRIKIERISFIHTVENFSTITANERHTVNIRSRSITGCFISSSLYFEDWENVMIQIATSDIYQILCKCDISLLDGSENIIKCGESENHYATHPTMKNFNILALSLTKTELLNREFGYLKGDKLSLICECTFSSGVEFQIFEDVLNEIPLAVQQKINYAHSKNGHKSSKELSTNCSVLEDLKSLYINKSLTDMQVKTDTKSFPAHKCILCARSPVFKAMMTDDMQEKNTNTIHINDLKDDIVQQLLLFLYTDTIEDLSWETATPLYYAADKYLISKLKEVCSSFLLGNISTANASALLLLTDTHSDTDLKKLVEDFIIQYDEQVFGSKEWDKFAESHPLLALRTMLLKYKRRNQ